MGGVETWRRGSELRGGEGIWGRVLRGISLAGFYKVDNVCVWKKRLAQRSPTFLAPGTRFLGNRFSVHQGWGDRFGMIQVYLLCSLFLLLLHQLYVRLSGIRSQRSGTLVLGQLSQEVSWTKTGRLGCGLEHRGNGFSSVSGPGMNPSHEDIPCCPTSPILLQITGGIPSR